MAATTSKCPGRDGRVCVGQVCTHTPPRDKRTGRLIDTRKAPDAAAHVRR